MQEQPQNIGPYRILGPLGRGGMGVIYRCEHRKTGAPAALKTVSLPHESLLQGIRREIHALSRIRHPGIVRILDEGLHEGFPWYAMELLEGRTLRGACAEAAAASASAGLVPASTAGPGPSRRLSAAAEPAASTGVITSAVSCLPIDPHQISVPRPAARLQQPAAGGVLGPVLTLLRRLCSPLAYLHGEGIVHRDLKPENVIVRHGGQPVLVDFGLVSRFTADLSREALELNGAVSGTVEYMAPEQLLGELLDARADLYSLGCILYELLTGRRPFEGSSVAQVAQGHLLTRPCRPSELVDGVPPQLDALVLQLLAKRPQDRLGHALDVAEALAVLGAEDGPGPAGPAPRAYLYRPGFSGRDNPLQQLGEQLSRLQKGTGGLVFIGGESGVGKTRLAMELSRRAQRQRLGVLVGESVPLAAAGADPRAQGAAPLQPLRAALQAIADRCRERGAEETERLLGRRGKLLALYESALAGLPGQDLYPEPAELPAEPARLRLYTYLTETFAALASARPLLLILDDLQWADDLTLGFLEHLLSAGMEAPLLIVGTYRTEEVRARHASSLQRLIDSQGIARIVLGPFEEHTVGSMVADMLALSPPPALFVHYLTRRSEGNPFFVAEYLRTAVAEELLYRDAEGRWQVATRGDAAATESVYEELPLPRSLRDLVVRRLDGLGAEARRLSERACVLGREVDELLLARMGRLGEARRLEAVRELLARQVLEEPAAGRLRFLHDQIREVAYDRLTARRRRELHCTAAKVIEARFGQARDEDLASLGHHWQRAGRTGRARECYLGGARYAVSHYAQAEAERLYRAHLALSEGPAAGSICVRIELASKVLVVQGRHEEALEEYGLSLVGAQASGEPFFEAQSLRGLASVQRDLGRFEQSRECSTQALAIARALGDDGFEARIVSGLGDLSCSQGRLEEAGALYEQGLALARRAGHRAMEAQGLAHLSILRDLQGLNGQARTLMEEALSRFGESGDRHAQVFGLVNLSTIRGHESPANEAEVRQLLEQALAIAREVGLRRPEGMILDNLAITWTRDGVPETAHALFHEALALHRALGDRRSLAITLMNQAYLERVVGRLDEAERLLVEAEPGLRGFGDPYHLSSYLCQRTSLALARGDPVAGPLEEARRFIRSADPGLAGRIAENLRELERIVAAAEAGRPMIHGEAVEDLPEGLRRWLVENGQLARSQASGELSQRNSPPVY